MSISQTEKDGLDISSDSRGRITLFSNYQAVCTVNKNGVAKPVHRPPSWSKIKTVHAIEGKTLNRVHFTAKTPQAIDAVVKRIPDTQRKIQCDRCPKTHRKTNAQCSANLGLQTFALKAGHLYDIRTGADLGTWKSDATFLGSATVGSVTYRRR